jgi:hypothetical protein
MLSSTTGIGQKRSLALKTEIGKQMSKYNDTSKVQISLGTDEALVLFEFLSRFEESNELKIVDQAEQRALSNLLGSLEKQLVPPFQEDYEEQIRQARNRLRDNFA